MLTYQGVSYMNLSEQILEQILRLPPEKQSQVLDFIAFLQQRSAPARRASKMRSLKKHPAFGSWRGRQLDALEYEQGLRSEWDSR